MKLETLATQASRLQIFISFLPFRFVSLHFVSQTTVTDTPLQLKLYLSGTTY